MSGSIDKEFRPFVRDLKRIEGIELKPKGRGGHVKILYHGRRVGSIPSSCSDVKALKALKTQLHKNGVPIKD